jgi:tetratricopeptide (TPR) repeat protein
LLTGGSRTALERHQTLRATLDWSHNLLPPPEQILLRRLSIFVNGWTLEAAESVCADESLHVEDIFDVLDQLVNKSLVSTEPWHAEVRYRMLETVRQYANEKLIEAGESEKLRDRHLEHFLDLAETAAPHLIRPEQLEWLDRLEAEHENMRTALEWSLGYERPEQALRLTAAFGTFWHMRCYWLEGAKWLERALAQPMENPTTGERIARARALIQEAVLADDLDNRDKMKTSAEASLALCEEGTDARDTPIARHWVGRVLNRFDEPERAHSLLEQSLEQFRNLNDVYWEAAAAYSITLVSIGKVQKPLGEKILQSLELARIAGERLLLAHALDGRATLAFWNGQLDEAEKYTMESEALYDQIGYTAKTGLINLGWLAHARNDYQRAKMFYTQAKELLEVIGEKVAKSSAIGLLAMVARDEGDFERAQFLIKEALRINREVGSRHMTGMALTWLGQVQLFLGNPEESKRNFIEGFSIIKELHSHYGKTESLLSFCGAYAGLQPKVVIQVLGFLHAYYRNILKEKFFPLVKREVDSALAQGKQHLSEADFNLAWAEGEKMTIEQAIDLALKTLDEI